MYLRRNRRKRDGEAYEYWTLVESVRTHNGPRQRIVAMLGKLPGLDEEARLGWEHIREVLDGRLHQRDLLKTEPDPPQWATVDTSGARVERLRRFGRLFQKYSRAKTLWRTYIGLTQIEDSFRISKHGQGLRPLYHQKPERTQSHILVCFLALVMWRTLQQWMHGCALGTAPRKLLEETVEIRSLDVVLPTRADKDIRLRTVSRPEQHLAILLQKMGLPVPNKPKLI